MNKTVFTKIGLSLLIALMVFAGCKKESLIVIKGTIQGTAYDGNTNAPLTGVEVKVVVDGKPKTFTTDDNGYFFNNLSSGEYYMTFTKGGYATVVANEEIPLFYGEDATIRGKEEGVYKHTRIVNPIMYSLDGSYTGIIYKQVNGKRTPAAGVTVYLDFSTAAGGAENADGATTGITPDLYSAVTDADGKFTFSNVPATYATVRTASFSEGSTDFGTFGTSVTLVPGKTMNLGEQTINTLNAAAYIASTVPNTNIGEKLAVTGNVQITFSKAIDQASVVGKLYSYNTGRFIPITVTWAKGTQTMTADPQETLDPSTDFYLSYSGKTADGIEFSNNFYFSTVDGISLVTSNLFTTEGNMTDAFDVASNITLTFNMAPDQAQTSAKGSVELWGFNSGWTQIDATVSFAGNVITIDPVSNLEPGMQYYVSFTVYSAYFNNGWGNTYYFETKSNLTAPTLAPVLSYRNDQDNNGTPEKYIDYNTTGVPVSLTTVTGATMYEIWAKDDKNNSDWVKIDTKYTSDYQQITKIDDWTYLPNQFDKFTTDHRSLYNWNSWNGFFTQYYYYESPTNYITPFEYGAKVSFKVRAGNDAGYGPWSNTITLGDENEIKSLYSTSNPGSFYSRTSSDNNYSFNNVTTTSRKITYTFKARSGEYFNTASTLQFIVDPAATVNVIPGSAITYKFVDHYTLEVTYTIPASTTYTNTTNIRLFDLQDASGNKTGSADAIQIWNTTLLN